MADPEVYAVVECAEAVEHARSVLAGRRIAMAATSPYVLEFCRREGLAFHALDGSVSQAEADAIGFASLDAAHAIARRLDADGGPDRPPLGLAVQPVLHRTLCAYLYKAHLLDRLVGHAGRTGAEIRCFGVAEDEAVRGFGLMPNRFATLLTVLGSRIGLAHEAFQGREPSGAQESGDFMRPSAWTRVVTLLNAPKASLAYRLWRRMLRGRPVSLPLSRGPAVLLYRSNELIEELILPLLRHGCALRSFAMPQFAAPDAACRHRPGGEVDELVATAVTAAWRNHGLQPAPAVTAAAAAVAARLACVLDHAAACAPQIRAAVVTAMADADNSGRPTVFLSNAMTAPADRLLRFEVERLGRPAIVAEHGVAPGLSPMHFAVGAREAPAWLGHTLLYTPAQRDLIGEIAGVDVAASCAVVGAPGLIRRVGARAIQRMAGRLALKASRRLIVWCTAFYPNNFQFLPHYWRDTHYHDIRRQVLDQVLGRLPDDVLLKLYPTYRYLDPDPLAGLVALPANCRVQQFVDFRNMRAAADVVIVDGPGSIMSWAWSARVPFVFLETGMYVVTDAARQALERGAFVVDCREDGWIDRFHALLAQDHASLRRQFAAKADARRDLEERFLFGPAGTGRSGVRFLRRMATATARAA
ncbi:MAG: hypothetical protein R3F55_23775 [Alphaproteobacteria bacterium]